MATLLEVLSEEILDRIISYMKDLKCLAALNRVSKRFYRLSLPHLYGNVIFEAGTSDQGVEYLRPFTFLMLQKPDLAALVRSFSLRQTYQTYGSCDPAWDPEQKVAWKHWPKHPDLESILHAAVRQAAQSEEELIPWWKNVHDGFNEAAILALLLPALIKLQFLDCPFCFEYDGDGDGVQSTYTLNMLGLAAERHEGSDGRPIFSDLTDVMGNHGEDDDADTFAALRPNSSPVQYVELRQSKLNIANFEAFIRAPKKLRTLIYEIGNTWAWTTVKTSAIQEALSFQAEHLENLALDHSPFCPFSIDSGDQMQPMDFSNLTALKTLKVAMIYLYGQEALKLQLGEGTRAASAPKLSQADIDSTSRVLVDALPTQLEKLRITYINDAPTMDRACRSLQELLSFREHRFPHLCELTLHGTYGDTCDHLNKDVCALLSAKAPEVRLILEGEQRVSLGKNNHYARRWGWNEDIEWAECVNDYKRPVEVLYDSRAL